MRADRKTLVILLCLAGSVPGVAGCGGDDGGTAAAAARPPASPPLEIALEPRHRSAVTGTARLVPAGEDLKVTLTLDERVPGRLMAHVHTGPCSDEPTATNPRIWANLNDVVDGRSETTVYVTLKELQSESSSINVHDPAHGNRPLVCGDIPRVG